MIKWIKGEIDMKKADFIRELAAKAKLTQKDTREILEVMGDVIVDHMKDDDGVAPFNGIKFIAVYREPRNARNPQTGEEFVTEAKYAPRVKFGKGVKEALN